LFWDQEFHYYMRNRKRNERPAFVFPASCRTPFVTNRFASGAQSPPDRHFSIKLYLFKSCPKPLPAAAGLIFDVRFVFFEQQISIRFTDTLGRRDIILSCFKPVDDLFGGLIGGLSAFSIKFGQGVVQTHEADLSVIGKFQHAPANCRLGGVSPVCSPFLVIMRYVLRRL